MAELTLRLLSYWLPSRATGEVTLYFLNYWPPQQSKRKSQCAHYPTDPERHVFNSFPLLSKCTPYKNLHDFPIRFIVSALGSWCCLSNQASEIYTHKPPHSPSGLQMLSDVQTSEDLQTQLRFLSPAFKVDYFELFLTQTMQPSITMGKHLCVNMPCSFPLHILWGHRWRKGLSLPLFPLHNHSVIHWSMHWVIPVYQTITAEVKKPGPWPL